MDRRIKITTLGDSGVGKTSILKRYCEKNVASNDINTTPTIGVDYGSFREENKAGQQVYVDLFDLSGKDKYQNVRREFYEGTDIFLLIFDLDDEKSFQRLNKWQKEISPFVKLGTNIYLVGNKSDIDSSRCISEKDLQKFVLENLLSKEYQVTCMYGTSVEDMFEDIFCRWWNSISSIKMK